MVKNIILVSIVISLASSSMAQKSQCACCTDQHRQFDFWLGEWIVYITGTDTIAGRNTIELQQDGCMLRESWTSQTSPFTGSSINFFDPSSGTWNQTWIDNSGLILKIQGNRSGNQMVMKSEPTYYKALDQTLIDKISWTEQADGTVRQVWERREVNSRDWQTVFDGTYVKKEETEKK